MAGRFVEITRDGRRLRWAIANTARGTWVGWPGHSAFLPLEETSSAELLSDDRISAPMTGKVLRVEVSPGDAVEADALLVVLEAMKMEYRLSAPRAGVVREVSCEEGELVELGAIVVTMEES